MDIEEIRRLIEELTSLMDEKKLDELKVDADGVKVVLRRGSRGAAQQVVVAPAPAVSHAAPSLPPVHEGTLHSEHEGAHRIVSQMVGTFYRAPAPDADPFVEVGDEVTPDTVLCIIEAMKVMNDVRAEVEGTVQAACVENGEAVEYGQMLFLIALRED